MTNVIICGKGGVGKTTITALLAENLAGDGLLVVDADPVGRLGRALGVSPRGTVAEALEPIAAQRGADRAAVSVQAVRDILTPVPGVGTLLVMGAHHHEGCFCTINRLLALAVQAVSEQFSMILVDNEAGVEHINRAAASKRADRLIIVAESTMPAVEVASALAKEAERRLSPSMQCLALTQVRLAEQDVSSSVEDMLRREWTHPVFRLPFSPAVVERTTLGLPILGLGDDRLKDAVTALVEWIKGGK